MPAVEIHTWADLDAIRLDPTASYILMADLDADSTGYDDYAGPDANDGKGWLPIGEWGDGFSGAFDGNGFTISDLTITDAEVYDIGLFGAVDAAGAVTDVQMFQVSVTVDPVFAEYSSVGALVGINSGTMTGCHAEDVSAYSSRVGGLAGINSAYDTDVGSISGCTAAGTVTGTGEIIGGLVGWNYWGAALEDCFSSADVSGANYVGGLAGSALGADVFDCGASGAVVGHDYIGGLMGSCEVNYMRVSEVRRSRATGDVSGTGEHIGGLVGCAFAIVENCYASGDVSGGTAVGGLIGTLPHYTAGIAGEVYKSHSWGAVSGDSDVGGLIGVLEQEGDTVCEDSFWDTQTSGQATSAGGTGKTTSEMCDIDTFTDTVATEGLDEAWDMAEADDHDGDPLTALWWVIDGYTRPGLYFELPEPGGALTMPVASCDGAGIVTSAWWQDSTPYTATRIYKCVLTGDDDGVEDAELPISSLQYRLYSSGRSYLSVVVPSAEEYADTVAARASGTLILYHGLRYVDGSEAYTEMARSSLGSMRYDKGARNSSLTLTGTSTVSFSTPPEFSRSIEHVSGEFLQADGNYRLRCAPIFGLYPGDAFEYDGTVYLADTVSVAIGRAFAQMEITYPSSEVGTLYTLETNTNEGVEW